MIEAQALSKTFDENLAVDAVDLSIGKGEAFAFLGPNGAGKTTTVRMLAGLIAPSSGTAVVNGHRVDREAAKVRASTGILTETPGLYERLDAVQNLRFYADLYQVPDPDRRVQKYLELVRLWDRRSEPVAGFSKGMRQRLALARAMLNEPPVLFLDEPTSGLDPESAADARDAIADLKSAGRTVFICTHNLYEAERLCDRIGIMKTRLIRVDTADALRRELFGRAVRVKLAEPSEAAERAVTALPFVKRLEASDGALVVELDDLEQHNPEVVRAVVEAGARVQFVEEVEHSLEQIYLQLIGDDGAKEEAP